MLGDKNTSRVVRVAVLESLGMPRPTVYRRCLPGGPWRRLLPGIVKLDRAEPSQRQRLEAALLRGGPDSMITGHWALRSYGLRRGPEPDDVHLLVPATREVTSAGFVLVERTTRLPEPVRRRGLPLAPVHRAVLDAARRVEDFDTVRAMLAEAVQRGRCRPDVLRRELEDGSQRGSALPRRALAELVSGPRSVAEGDALRLWRRAGLPECAWNVAVYEVSGGYVATPDAWCDDVAFAWEIDSKEFYFELDGYAGTLARNARYAAAGIVLLATLPARLRKEPGAVVRELRAAYEAAAARPRPPVRMR
ncbi:hypothetical protein B0I33_10258 [Prauserella shujinwangii]|uniref:Transcriptional regulator, AbiEi antitoxin, Type IV TA system n=1 Tax=Prauserella shujinwangii TaxID=1453103 RepID=A0A2T0M013_9PSEU|nr:hypothetical protein B0I33_10258 [Prauserella shujinwangii]